MSSSSSSTDLRNRIIFTIAILAVYRFGTFVPLPGIDPEQLKILMEGNQKGLLGMFNVFSGGCRTLLGNYDEIVRRCTQKLDRILSKSEQSLYVSYNQVSIGPTPLTSWIPTLFGCFWKNYNIK